MRDGCEIVENITMDLAEGHVRTVGFGVMYTLTVAVLCQVFRSCDAGQRPQLRAQGPPTRLVLNPYVATAPSRSYHRLLLGF